MTDKERIEQACQEQGFSIQSWDEKDDDGITARLGPFNVLNNEDEDYGLFEGDEGVLSACVVGAAEYGNQRVAFIFIAEGCDEGNEVHSLDVLEPADRF